jgi:hypothetical protein
MKPTRKFLVTNMMMNTKIRNNRELITFGSMSLDLNRIYVTNKKTEETYGKYIEMVFL